MKYNKIYLYIQNFYFCWCSKIEFYLVIFVFQHFLFFIIFWVYCVLVPQTTQIIWGMGVCVMVLVIFMPYIHVLCCFFLVIFVFAH